MPNETYSDFQSAWLGFASSAEGLLVPDLDDAVLYKYVQFRDNVFALVKSPDFLEAMEQGWNSSDYKIDDRIKNLVLLELRAFPLAVEAAEVESKQGKEKRSWWRKLFPKASTTIESIEKICEGLPSWAKGGLIALRELFDIFKGGAQE